MEDRYKKIQADNEKLEALGRFKGELLSLASHQMRARLAAIKGYVALVMDDSRSGMSDKAKEMLARAQASADELINLVDTLLDMSKIEEGKMEYCFEKTDLAELVAVAVDSVVPLAAAKNLSMTFHHTTTNLLVNIDKQKFKEVIQNLLDNAVKYTPSGFVDVELNTDGSKAFITVSDSGLGIRSSLIPFLFEEFIRDERVKKEIRGTGLGLYIARKITEAHGGTISAESPGEGKGSIFKISLPITI